MWKVAMGRKRYPIPVSFANDKKFLGAINRKPTGVKAAQEVVLQFSIVVSSVLYRFQDDAYGTWKWRAE